jgi:hypothetical protein
MVNQRPTRKSSKLAEQISAIMSSQDASLRNLVESAGLDPQTDFANRVLIGLPLKNEDIAGFNFSGSDLRETNVHDAINQREAQFSGSIFDRNLPSLDPAVISFNANLKKLEPKLRQIAIDKELEKPDGRFDVVTMGTSVSRSRDIAAAVAMYDKFVSRGVLPNVFVFSSLIQQSPTEEVARGWYDEMLKARIEPDVTTFNTLINKSPTEEVARGWYDEMFKARIEPDSYTHYHGKRFG